MKAESIVFALAGMCFGIILGWVLGSGQARDAAAQPAQATAQAAAPAAQTQASLDEARVQSLTTILNSDPDDPGAALELANTYFDGQRFEDAVRWYERALELDPQNVNASTDLGVSYYYTNRADEALRQFDYSLTIDAVHAKTLLNQGIVLAFGKEDLDAAAESWARVVELDPDSPEGQTAQRALDGVAAAHPDGP